MWTFCVRHFVKCNVLSKTAVNIRKQCVCPFICGHDFSVRDSRQFVNFKKKEKIDSWIQGLYKTISKQLLLTFRRSFDHHDLQTAHSITAA